MCTCGIDIATQHATPATISSACAAGAGDLGDIDLQIERCRAAGLPYVYLGYWIAESRKMAYKATFRPAEGLVAGSWSRL